MKNVLIFMIILLNSQEWYAELQINFLHEKSMTMKINNYIIDRNRSEVNIKGINQIVFPINSLKLNNN
jgi:hypothetical protein